MITDAGVLKVGDFGQARPLVAKEDSDFSHQISTRWYRSPELLFGARFYTTAIDLSRLAHPLNRAQSATNVWTGETVPVGADSKLPVDIATLSSILLALHVK